MPSARPRATNTGWPPLDRASHYRFARPLRRPIASTSVLLPPGRYVVRWRTSRNGPMELLLRCRGSGQALNGQTQWGSGRAERSLTIPAGGCAAQDLLVMRSRDYMGSRREDGSDTAWVDDVVLAPAAAMR